MQLPEKRGMSFRRQMFIERYRLSRYSDQREEQGNLRRVDGSQGLNSLPSVDI